jgi:hypothetical protein
VTARWLRAFGITAEDQQAVTRRSFTAMIAISDKAVGEHRTSIFAKLDLAPSDDDNRRVLAVPACLNPDGGDAAILCRPVTTPGVRPPSPAIHSSRRS